MGASNTKAPHVVVGEPVPTEVKQEIEDDVYRQVYRQAQVDTLNHIQGQTDKAIHTAVDAKLKRAEEAEARELAAAVAELDTLARRAPLRPVRCAKERSACLACYKANGAVDPLLCKPAVDALEACSDAVVKSLVYRGGRGSATVQE